MKKYPENTEVAVILNQIIRKKEAAVLSERMSSRMVKIAAHLPENEFIGWQMEVPTTGLARLELFGSAAVHFSDVEWIAEEIAKTNAVKDIFQSYAGDLNISNWNLYEIQLSSKTQLRTNSIGFGINWSADGPKTQEKSILRATWPMHFSRQFGEFVRALRIEGALLRYTVARATYDEQKDCEKSVAATWKDNAMVASEYIGLPVQVKMLLMLPDCPSVRLLTVVDEIVPGAEWRCIGKMSKDGSRRIWDNPMSEPRVLPDIAARILAMEPTVGASVVIGVESCLPAAKPIPAGHPDPAGKKVIPIGKALGTSGMERTIFLGDADLRRHWQIVGQTGTGKSTLLAAVIRDVIIGGRGVTFFDPHGQTIDVLLQTVPKKYADRIRVVHFGDAENPVPITMWPSENPEECEKTISDLNQLFVEIFDPNHEGIVGPRWERWFSVFAASAIALMGKKASFDSIITFAQSRDNMSKLANAIEFRYPNLAKVLKSEYAGNDSREFADAISWYICKFQRLISIPQLRNTLGAGANALDFNKTVDTNAVTLIDLGSPEIGAHASRILGTFLLLQLWNAVTSRQNRKMTHVVAIDEAHLFQTDPLPQMLAEGRKFGLAMILAHQHCGQLSREVRDALDANSANFSAFRLSVRDAVDAVVKFDDRSLNADLCRLNAFNALTTISVDGKQTPVFTLRVDKPNYGRNAKRTKATIEDKSIQQLVTPYKNCRALSADEILDILNNRKNILQPLKRNNEKSGLSVDEGLLIPQKEKEEVPVYIQKLCEILRNRKSTMEEDYVDEVQ